MSTNPKTQHPDGPSNLEKDPDDWTTGDDPMTGAQASYLKTLSEEAGEEFDDVAEQGRGLEAHRRASREDRQGQQGRQWLADWRSADNRPGTRHRRGMTVN